MTEKLYYKDAYIKEFSAKVLSLENRGEYYETVLDKTAFFPEEGGQYSDRGYISGVRVYDVRERDGVIYHCTKEPIEVGIEVSCSIDFDERFEKMQCHTAEHILSGLFHKHFGVDNVGFHLGGDDVTMDISAPLTRENLSLVESLANEIIYKNIEVTTRFPKSEELSSLTYRSKLDLTENVRIVDIGEYDSCACCAPHVRYTGEIGIIKILDFEKLRGGMRIHITAGRRAFSYLSDMYSNVRSVGALLSATPNEIHEVVGKLLSDYTSLKSEYQNYKSELIRQKAREVERTEGNLVINLDGADISEMIEFSNVALSSVGGILVLLSGGEGSTKYVISSKSINLRECSAKINAALGGKGGGRPEMIQGSFTASIEEIEAFFEK